MLAVVLPWAKENPRLFIFSCVFWLLLAAILVHAVSPLW